MKASTANEPQQANKVDKVTRGLKTSLLGAGACFILAVHAAFPEELRPQTGAASGLQRLAQKPAAVPEGASGMIITSTRRRESSAEPQLPGPCLCS
jgi:hypothetical protein